MYHYTEKDIINCLKTFNLKPDDNIFIHSNVALFGLLKDAKNAQSIYQSFKNAFRTVLGYSVTIISPTFSFSFCKNEIFIYEETISTCGFFSEQARKDNHACRSEDANFSIVSIGKNSDFFTNDSDKYSFGKSSFWKRFLEKKGKFLNFNLNSGFSTFVHFAEREFQVPYRYDKPFPGTFIKNGRSEKRVYYHYVTESDNQNHRPDVRQLENCLDNLNLVKRSNLGKGQMVLTQSEDLFNIINEQLAKNISFLIKGTV